MTIRKKHLPDLGDLLGDPYLSGPSADYQDDAPDPVQTERELDELRAAIDALPNGSLSGGVPYPHDTWLTADVAQYYEPATKRAGLSDAEKEIVFEEGRKMIERRTGSDQIKDRTWQQFAAAYPQLASDEFGVAEAAKKVARELRAEGQDVKQYMRERPTEFNQRVAGNADPYFGTSAATASNVNYSNQEVDLGRDASISGGRGAGGASQTQDGPHDDQAWYDDLRKKGGYY
jgi:hypothetical protein